MSDVMESEEMAPPDMSLRGTKKNLLEEFNSPPAPKPTPMTATATAGHERMRVYLRVRPFTDDEVNRGENQASHSGAEF